jgi:amino acid transporter
MNGIWASFLTIVGSFERLFSYVIFVSWIFYALGAAAVIVLRRKQPWVERPYRTWGYPVVPIVFCVIAAAIVLNTVANDFRNSFWGLQVVATGLPPTSTGERGLTAASLGRISGTPASWFRLGGLLRSVSVLRVPS